MAAAHLQTSDNLPNECRCYRQNSRLIQFFSCFECLYRLNRVFISILDFCTNKGSTQCVFLCAPILTESNNHSVSKSLYNKNGIKLRKEKLSYTIALELVRKQTECHFLKSTTIRHTWSALRWCLSCHRFWYIR